MSWQNSIFTILLFVTTTFVIALALNAWRRHTVPGATALMWLTLAVAVWTLTYALELVSADLPTKLFWAKCQYIGIVSAPPAWLCFTLHYTGRGRLLTPRRLLALLLIPAITLLLVWTNEWHGLIWIHTGLVRMGSLIMLDLTHGAWFWIHTAFCYLAMLLGGILLLAAILRRSQRLYRRQMAALLLSSIAPWVGNALYIFKLDPFYPLDPTPFAFALAALALGWCLFRFRLLDIVPVARGAIVEGLREGIIVLDEHDRVVDLNPAAERMTGQPATQAVGRPITDLLPSQPALQHGSGAGELRIEITLGAAQAQRFYDTRISPLLDQRGQRTGRLVIVHDITERKKAEEARRFLAEASTLMGGSLDEGTTLAIVADMTVPHLADWCAVHMLVEDGSFHEVALAHQDPAKVELVRTLLRANPLPPDAPYSVPLVLRTGQPELIAAVTDEHLAAFASSAEQLVLFRSLQIQSSICVPLITRGRVIGALTLMTAESRRRYSPPDLALAEELGHRVALSVDNARFYRKAQRHLTEVTTVQRVARAANSTLQLDAIFQTVVGQISTTFGYQLVSIYLREGEGLALQAAVGYSEVMSFIPLDRAVSGRVARTGQAAFVRDAADDPDFIVVAEGTRQAIITPLKSGAGPVLGTLLVESTGVPPLTDDDFALLTLLADQVSIAIANARLFAELQASEQRFRTLMAQAESATRAKSEFLANMSHEIRTPLNGVIGMAELLLGTQLGAQEREIVETIQTCGNALLGVINDILDFSKIESGKLDLEHYPFYLRDCVEESLDLIAINAAEKQIDLGYTIDTRTPSMLIGDKARLRQILVNLLSNAVKFTEKGEVVIAVWARSLSDNRYSVQFMVKDTGIGIPRDRQDRLFQMFSQLDAATTRQYGGTGLGLAISKRLSEAMGGTMWVESEASEGATFYFTIVAEAAPSSGRMSLRGSLPQLAGKRMLIVDDTVHNRRMLSMQAQSWGMLARDTASSAQALEWIRAGDPFDVAVLDARMPGMDGPALAAEIRKYRDAGSLPLIMLSSLGQRDEGLRQAGEAFQAVLNKPVKLAQLHAILVGVCEKQPDQRAQPAPVAPSDPAASVETPRILLAEDNQVNQKLVRLMLEKLGYQADVANNGREALGVLQSQRYDLLLLDVQMPEVDGLEVARQVCRRWPKDQRPYMVALTANAMMGDREQCLNAGMDDYISKPIQLEALKRVLAGRPAQPAQDAPPAPPRTNGAANRPTAATPGVPKAIDAEALAKLRALLGPNAAATLKNMIDGYVEDAARLLETMRGAAERDDAQALGRAAHKLKSSSGMLAALRLSQLCGLVEEAARRGDGGDLRERVRQIEVEYDRARSALELERQPAETGQNVERQMRAET